MSSGEPRDISFGPFRLDRRNRTLLRGETPMALGGRAFDVLAALAAAGGETVSKDGLLDQVWPGLTVEENNLQVQMVALRKALGDGWIVTIPGRGYRLTVPPADAAPPADPVPQTDGGKPTVAVLPFANISGDASQEYFSDGMTEEIITALSRVRSLIVIARHSSFAYKGRDVEPKQVGRDLDVRYLVEGSVRRFGNRVRIAGHLLDAKTGAQFWADRFDGTLEDVFALQDQVTASVVAAIEPSLRAAEIQRAQRKPTGNLQAYDFMLRALPHYYTRTPASLAEAARLLRRSVEIDPTYALGLAYLANCLWITVSQGWVKRGDPAVAEMLDLAQAALAYDSRDPEVLVIVAGIVARAGGDLGGAISMVDKSIALNPNSADAFTLAGTLNAYAGDTKTALEQLERGMRLNPLGLKAHAHFGFAMAHFVAGDYEEVVESTGKALRDRPHYTAALRYRAASLGLLGRVEEARPVVQRLLDVVPDFTVARARRYLEFDMNNIFKTPGVANAFYEGLRRAGVPE